MSNFSNEIVNRIWRKGTKIEGLDPEEYRLDAAGALMIKSHRGSDDLYDWEIDHVCPKAKLEDAGISEKEWDNENNLRPFNAKNNNSKSDDYPIYTKALEFDKRSFQNFECQKVMEVNKDVQHKIKRIYGI